MLDFFTRRKQCTDLLLACAWTFLFRLFTLQWWIHVAALGQCWIETFFLQERFLHLRHGGGEEDYRVLLGKLNFQTKNKLEMWMLPEGSLMIRVEYSSQGNPPLNLSLSVWTFLTGTSKFPHLGKFGILCVNMIYNFQIYIRILKLQISAFNAVLMCF